MGRSLVDDRLDLPLNRIDVDQVDRSRRGQHPGVAAATVSSRWSPGRPSHVRGRDVDGNVGKRRPAVSPIRPAVHGSVRDAARSRPPGSASLPDRPADASGSTFVSHSCSLAGNEHVDDPQRAVARDDVEVGARCLSSPTNVPGSAGPRSGSVGIDAQADAVAPPRALVQLALSPRRRDRRRRQPERQDRRNVRERDVGVVASGVIAMPVGRQAATVAPVWRRGAEHGRATVALRRRRPARRASARRVPIAAAVGDRQTGVVPCGTSTTLPLTAG